MIDLHCKTTQLYLGRQPVGFRKSINGLLAIVEQEFELNAFSDSLFVFTNRPRNKIKALYWHGNGFCLWYKRLEKGCFSWPKFVANQTTTQLTSAQFEWLISGVKIGLKNSQKKTNNLLYFNRIT